MRGPRLDADPSANDGEVAGLLALMLLTDARRAARTDADGSLVPLAWQRREPWDSAAIAEGLALRSRRFGLDPDGSIASA